uniref:Putative secreted protein n=1 Tax=Amblyomma triste TaxID=251400 RepID=A0A023GDU9_AMBTT
MKKSKIALLATMMANLCQAFRIEGMGDPKITCKENEDKLRCSNGNIKEGLCPGVLVQHCKIGDDVCKCKEGTFRKDDKKCVPLRECVTREFHRGFLHDNQEIFQVGMSGNVWDNTSAKCIRGTRTSNSLSFEYFKLKFQDRTKNWADSEYDIGVEVVQPNPQSEWELRINSYAAGRTPDPRIHSSYPILHGSDDCLILFLTNLEPGNDRRDCVYFVKKSAVQNQRPWRCDFLFNNYCHRPFINLQQLDDKCS